MFAGDTFQGDFPQDDKAARIIEWAVSIPNPYAAPEVRGRPTANGQISHPYRGYPAGANIKSSAIVKAEGRVLTTRSGSTYILEGSPHPEWVKAMEAAGVAVDLDNPLKEWGL